MSVPSLLDMSGATPPPPPALSMIMHHILDKDGRLYRRSETCMPRAGKASVQRPPQVPRGPITAIRPIYTDGRNAGELATVSVIINPPKKRFIDATSKMSYLRTEDDDAEWEEPYTQRRKEFICGFCGTNKTPEIRPSSLGPGTLCNKCGLRWRRGNLPQVDDLAMERNGRLYEVPVMRIPPKRRPAPKKTRQMASSSEEKLSVNFLVN